MSFISKVVTGAFVGLVVYAVAENHKRKRQFKANMEALSKFNAEKVVSKSLEAVVDDLADHALESAKRFRDKANELRSQADAQLKAGDGEGAANLAIKAARYDAWADVNYNHWFEQKGKNQQPVWTPSA